MPEIEKTYYNVLLSDGKLLRQWSVSWQHVESGAMVVDEEVDEVIDENVDRNSTTISRLEIRLRLTNGDVSGLVESECTDLIDFCCREKNSAVSLAAKPSSVARPHSVRTLKWKHLKAITDRILAARVLVEFCLTIVGFFTPNYAY